ncbi:flagellin [Hwanghaeella sp.]|uniref:flagellin N-terminal helical domain-containing protein n=1 Tax=Hwanghaeella sp. TaxID=2605943 RepID=UPI003CCBEB3F
MGDIALTAAQRSSLLSLQQTQTLSDRTQTRLTTGKAVNSVVDDAVNFFRAQALSDRGSDFALRRDEIDQGVSSLSTALQAVESVDNLLNQLQGIVEAARSQSTAERQSATTQFIEVGKQISELIEDASFAGLNLLNSTNSTLDVSFGVRTSSRLQVTGFNLNTTAADSTTGIFTVAAFTAANSSFTISNFGISSASFTSFGADNSNVSFATTAVQRISTGISNLRARGASLGANVAILQTRLDFTDAYVNELQVGSDKLTLADLNEEGANLVALQTRQQLGIQSLAISGQQQQAILALLN